MRPRYPALVCLLILVLGAAHAGAQPAGDPPSPDPASPPPGEAGDPVAAARAHYARAEQAMSQGDHAVAVAGYTSAYEITRDPVLLRKIAGAHDEAGQCAEARVYYQRYLAEGNPDASFRAQVEGRMQACQDDGPRPAGADAGNGQAGAFAAAARDPEPAREAPAGGLGERPPSFADQEPSWQRSAAWISVGAAVALATTGAMLAMSAESREEDLDYLVRYRDLTTGAPARYSGQVRERYEELVAEGERLELYSRLVLGAAGLAAVSAVVFFVLDSSSAALSPAEHQAQAAARRRIAPELVPGGLGVVAGWEF